MHKLLLITPAGLKALQEPQVSTEIKSVLNKVYQNNGDQVTINWLYHNHEKIGIPNAYAAIECACSLIRFNYLTTSPNN